MTLAVAAESRSGLLTGARKRINVLESEPSLPAGEDLNPLLRCLRFPYEMQDLPPERVSDVMEIDRASDGWWIAQTRPQYEKRFAAELEREGIAHYLPLATRRSFAHGRWHWVEVPLFTTYVAFAGSLEDRCAAATTRKALRFIEVVNRPRFVSQLHAVQLALAENPKLRLFQGSPIGKLCRIIGGSLIGKEGRCDRIVEGSSRVRLILRVDMLGDSVETEVDAEHVELL